MRRVACILLFIAPQLAHANPASALSWLSGCWRSERGESGSGEMWTSSEGGALFGVSRTIRDGKLVEYEFMQIRETAPGRLAFIARPSGQSEASFPLVRLAEREVVFENAAHDFPQRVMYRLDEHGVLRARIEGVQAGKHSAFDFPMRKAPCP
jgi:hypothetical protein